VLNGQPLLAKGTAHLRRGDRHLLVHGQRPRWAALNPTGYQVARLCDGHHTLEQILSEIGARYAQSPEAVREDVARCLARLQEAGLLAGDDDAPAYRPPTLAGLRLHLNLAGGCNLRCVHCGVAGVSAAAELPTDVVLRLIDELASASAEGIAISGGEPLRRDDCLSVLRYATQRLGKVVVSTNGTLIDDRMAAELVGLGLPVQVSLDGATPAVHDRIRGAGAFERTWHGINLLLQRGIQDRLALCMTLMRWNLHQVPQLIDLAEARGVAGVRIMPLQRLGRAAEKWAVLGVTTAEYARVYDHLYREVPRSNRRVVVQATLLGFAPTASESEPWCGLGRTLAVDAGGDIYACSMLMAPQFRLGNVQDTRLEEAMGSPHLRQLCQDCTARRTTIECCRSCAWRSFCQGGCPASVLAEKGTLWATDDLCAIRQRLYSDTLLGLAERQSAAQPGVGEDMICSPLHTCS